MSEQAEKLRRAFFPPLPENVTREDDLMFQQRPLDDEPYFPPFTLEEIEEQLF